MRAGIRTATQILLHGLDLCRQPRKSSVRALGCYGRSFDTTEPKPSSYPRAQWWRRRSIEARGEFALELCDVVQVQQGLPLISQYVPPNLRGP